MDLEGQLRARVTELNAQKQKCGQLIQNLNRESLILDGMISEAVNTLNGIIKSKESKADESACEPKKRKGRKSKN